MKSKVEIINRTKKRIPKDKTIHLVQWIVLNMDNKKFNPYSVRNASRLDQQLTLTFLDNKEMTQLNRRYRGKMRPTDVLSFEGPGDTDLGELVFCEELIRKQAKQHHLKWNQELAYLVIHGVLHLLGYDHEGSLSQKKRMFRIQDHFFHQFLIYYQ